MARTLPRFRSEVLAQIAEAISRPQPRWARRRLDVVRLIGEHQLTVVEIMRQVGVSRQTVFTYRDAVVAGGVPGLLTRGKARGNRSVVNGAVREAFQDRVNGVGFGSIAEVSRWIKECTGRVLTSSGAGKVLRRCGGELTACDGRRKGNRRPVPAPTLWQETAAGHRIRPALVYRYGPDYVELSLRAKNGWLVAEIPAPVWAEAAQCASWEKAVPQRLAKWASVLEARLTPFGEPIEAAGKFWTGLRGMCLPGTDDRVEVCRQSPPWSSAHGALENIELPRMWSK